SIFAVGGIIALAIMLLDFVASDKRMASVMLLLVSLFLFALDQFRPEFSRDAVKKRDAELEVPFVSVPAGTPLVIASGLSLLPTDMYASDADLARTYYLVDRTADLRYTGSTIFDFG